MTDTQLFPPTPEERLAAVRTHLADEVEKREKAASAAYTKLDEARQLLETFDEAMKARAGIVFGYDPGHEVKVDAGVAAAVRDMKRHAEEAGIDVSIKVGDEEEIVISEPPAVDPITGEATAIPVANWRCPTCHGDGRLPDKTGGGHHRCKDCHGTGHAEPSCDNCTSSDCNLKQQTGSSTMGCGGSSWLHGEVTSDAEPGDNIYPPPGHDVPAAMGLRPEPPAGFTDEVFGPDPRGPRKPDA